MKLQNPSGVFELNRQERRGSFFGTLLSQLPRVQRLEDEAPLESPQGFFFPRDFCAHPSFPECASCSEMLRDLCGTQGSTKHTLQTFALVQPAYFVYEESEQLRRNRINRTKR